MPTIYCYTSVKQYVYKTSYIFKTVFGSTSNLNGFGTFILYYRCIAFYFFLIRRLKFSIDLHGDFEIKMTSYPTSSEPNLNHELSKTGHVHWRTHRVIKTILRGEMLGVRNFCMKQYRPPEEDVYFVIYLKSHSTPRYTKKLQSSFFNTFVSKL